MRTRDEPAFEAFVAARSNDLLRTAVLLTRDRGHAEDLLQTARVTAYRRWSRIDGEDPRSHVRRVLTAPLDGVTLRLVDASGALVAEGPLTQPVP